MENEIERERERDDNIGETVCRKIRVERIRENEGGREREWLGRVDGNAWIRIRVCVYVRASSKPWCTSERRSHLQGQYNLRSVIRKNLASRSYRRIDLRIDVARDTTREEKLSKTCNLFLSKPITAFFLTFRNKLSSLKNFVRSYRVTRFIYVQPRTR